MKTDLEVLGAPDPARFAVHTMTLKPWSLVECTRACERSGIRALGVWRNVVDAVGAREAGRILRDSGIVATSLVRGGFFPSETEAGRRAALDDNIRALDDAVEVGAPLLVLVSGSVPALGLEESRRQIRDGIEILLPHAAARGVKLAIEPLHPMYAADRSAVNTLAQARELCEDFRHPYLGIALDVYHLWWDPDLEAEIRRVGAAGWILAYHVSDWRTPTRDFLEDRGLMGEGCIPLRRIRAWVEEAGFHGWIEVEIFSAEKWAGDQARWLEEIREAYAKWC